MDGDGMEGWRWGGLCRFLFSTILESKATGHEVNNRVSCSSSRQEDRRQFLMDLWMSCGCFQK